MSNAMNKVKEKIINKMKILIIDLIRIVLGYVGNDSTEVYINNEKNWFATRIIGDRLYILKKDSNNKVITCIFSKTEPLYTSYATGDYGTLDTTKFEDMSTSCSNWLKKFEGEIKNYTEQAEFIKKCVKEFKFEFLRELMTFLCEYKVIADDNCLDLKKLLLVIDMLLKCDNTKKETQMRNNGGYVLFQVYKKHKGIIGLIGKLLKTTRRRKQYHKIYKQMYGFDCVDGRVKFIVKENLNAKRTVFLTNNGQNLLEKMNHNNRNYRKMYFFNRSNLIKFRNELNLIIKFIEEYMTD